MKLKYLCILFGVFYSAFLITAPKNNKSKKNTRTRSTSKRRPTQRKTMSRGKTPSRGMSRGGGSSIQNGITPSPITPTLNSTTPTPTPGMTPSPITPTSSAPTQETPEKKREPLNIAFFDQKVIKLDSTGKESITKTKEKLQEIKNKLNKEKTELIKLQKSLETKPKTITNKEIIEKEENYRKELDAKKSQKLNN